MEKLITGEDQILSIITGAICLLILMALAIIIFFYFSRKKIIKTQLEKANMEIAHQKEVLQSTLITQEEERKRIAQDLHDAISSKLNIVSLNANFLTEDNITPPEANTIGKHISNITATILESSRKIAHDLLPPTLEKFGLEAALEELCEEVGDTKKFEVHHDLSYSEAFLDSDRELHLFRIVQELINNSIKHSNATQINLVMKTGENQLYLQYRDNGKGFDVVKAQQAKGLGMSGIKNRADILSGILHMESSPGNGINITVKIQR
ncbi:histidine kinase [Ulvibacter sp. MAR_2010_11]|uniref:sensor histidine kinase n=1 Tax=Ulvibacter sp. MAR_2010_11 TaxID=1250229 RepID=UPI000C2BFDEA|nr:ATP-binding protein [Ulvibacter sp. MAR_2010_11]PKA84436.1 histidine kinase [Ulvibacter sp. MAR_2010_11]